MSGLSRCWVPMKMPVANSKTRTSYEGALSAKPGVPGSGGRPTPGGAHSISVGSIRGWMQVQPAAESWPGVTPSALAGRAVAPAAPSAAVRATRAMHLHLVMVLLMTSPFVSAFRSPLRLDAQHFAAVVAHPQGSEADGQPHGLSSQLQPADDPVRTRVDPQDSLRVEVSHPDRTEADGDSDRRRRPLDYSSRPVRPTVDAHDGTRAMAACRPDPAVAGRQGRTRGAREMNPRDHGVRTGVDSDDGEGARQAHPDRPGARRHRHVVETAIV